MRTKCRLIATFHRPIHSHWSLPLSPKERRNLCLIYGTEVRGQEEARGWWEKSLMLFAESRIKKIYVRNYFPGLLMIFICLWKQLVQILIGYLRFQSFSASFSLDIMVNICLWSERSTLMWIVIFTHHWKRIRVWETNFCQQIFLFGKKQAY